MDKNHNQRMDPDGFEDEWLKGSSRPPMMFDMVPLMPFIVALSTVAMIGVLTHPLVNFAIVPLFFIMAMITRSDDQKFRQIGLFVYCRIIKYDWNSIPGKAASYSPLQRIRK